MLELIQNLKKVLLVEALSPEEMAQIQAELAVPEILPCTFDVTIPGWLERIKLWGRITIKHADPENFWGKKTVSINQFLDKISNDELTRMLGKFHIVKLDLTSCSFERDYQGRNGKWYTEKFIIAEKLNKRLK